VEIHKDYKHNGSIVINRAIKNEIEGVRKWYDSIANHFVKRYEGKGGEYLRIFEEDVFVRLVQPGLCILDLGCGHGRFATRMIQRGEKRVFAVDLSMEMLKKSTNRDFPRIQGDAVELCFKDNSFDTVVSMGMFEYLKDPTPFLNEINRILRSRGELIFTFHQVRSSYKKPWEDSESLYFGRMVKERDDLWKRVTRTLYEMRRYLFNCGFEIEKVRRLFFRIPAILFETGFETSKYFRILGKEIILLSLIVEAFLSTFFSKYSNGNTLILARKIK
jgi:ubiquinone/menaquinone biosynthesis C-methylase UbiE